MRTAIPAVRLVSVAIAVTLLCGLILHTGSAAVPAAQGIHTIKHVVIIMQENRSFDNYFGTFPGADGIPMKNGVPTACLPDPHAASCLRPFYDAHDLNFGGPHGEGDARADIDGGRMDGFVRQERLGLPAEHACRTFINPGCAENSRIDEPPDVLGYHDARQIPNYWSYAHNFVLQDHMFAPNASWSLPAHLYMVSEWSAACSRQNVAASCRNALQRADFTLSARPPTQNFRITYAWTDLTYLLFKHHVSWGYYVAPGSQPDCMGGAVSCTLPTFSAQTPEIWNPLPLFTTVHQDNQLGNIMPLDRFYSAAAAGTLPAVSWVVPDFAHSEHAPATLSAGQAWVTGLINAVMRGPDWSSTAIFLAWDEWGGFYDHVTPPTVDQNGYGLRVPGLVISAYARKGYIDHQVLSFDAYVKFIEDDFLGGQRLDPSTDGRPDPRPDVRENVSILGDLRNDFDFSQPPRPPQLLPLHPQPGQS